MFPLSQPKKRYPFLPKTHVPVLRNRNRTNSQKTLSPETNLKRVPTPKTTHQPPKQHGHVCHTHTHTCTHMHTHAHAHAQKGQGAAGRPAPAPAAPAGSAARGARRPRAGAAACLGFSASRLLGFSASRRMRLEPRRVKTKKEGLHRLEPRRQWFGLAVWDSTYLAWVVGLGIEPLRSTIIRQSTGNKYVFGRTSARLIVAAGSLFPDSKTEHTTYKSVVKLQPGLAASNAAIDRRSMSLVRLVRFCV